jgi:alpha-1,6-mannosyltransferase
MTILSYTIIYVSTSLIFIAVSWLILKYEMSPKFVGGLIALSVVIRFLLIPVQPVGSDDWFRYVWDGKVLNAGINPYRYSPVSPALSQLHSNALPSKINFSDMRTLYPPLAEILFYFAYKIGGESFLGIKVLLFVFDLTTIYGISLILRTLKSNSRDILFYALCPLPIFQFFIDAHVDGFGITLFVFSIFFYIVGKKNLSYFLIGLSASVKLLSLILVPIFFFNEKTVLDRVRLLIIPFGVLILSYLPFVFTGNPFQSLMTFAENWTFNGIVFDFLNMFIRDNQRTRLICGICFVIIFLVILLWRRRGGNMDEKSLSKIYASIFLLYIFSPVVHPWYVSWLAVLLPIMPRWSGIFYVGLVSLTTFTVLNYQLTGVWKEYPVALLFEYVPVLSLFVYELRSATNHRKKTHGAFSHGPVA